MAARSPRRALVSSGWGRGQGPAALEGKEVVCLGPVQARPVAGLCSPSEPHRLQGLSSRVRPKESVSN